MTKLLSGHDNNNNMYEINLLKSKSFVLVKSL